MARTKASVGAKVSSGKSSKARCSAAPPPTSNGSSGSSDRASRNHSGGNPVCPRETPKWQRPITNFFVEKQHCQTPDGGEVDNNVSGASKSKPKRNVIESDNEDEIEVTERPINKELDETIELEPLTGEDSHKIEEYYPKNGEVKESTAVNGEVKESTAVNGEVKESTAANGNDVKDNVTKGKGKGKKTNKENIDTNVEQRKSVKRDLDEIASEESSENVSKKVKVT